MESRVVSMGSPWKAEDTANNELQLYVKFMPSLTSPQVMYVFYNDVHTGHMCQSYFIVARGLSLRFGLRLNPNKNLYLILCNRAHVDFMLATTGIRNHSDRSDTRLYYSSQVRMSAGSKPSGPRNCLFVCIGTSVHLISRTEQHGTSGDTCEVFGDVRVGV